MTPKKTQIAPGIFKFSTYVPEIAPPAGFGFNQYLVLGSEPLLFHTGPRHMFKPVMEAVGSVIAPQSLRWISFGHVESDECGAMNDWLAIAPDAQIVHGATACMVSLNDLADRPPRVLSDGEVLDLGGKRVRWIDTPHVPHAWESGLIFEEVTETLFSGDLFSQIGDGIPVTAESIVPLSVRTEEMFKATSLTPWTGSTIRKLADLKPRMLAVMHGQCFAGDCAAELLGLADYYESSLKVALR